jgi:hypothetical protein
MAYKRFSLCLDDKTAEQVEMLMSKTGKSLADTTRDLIKKGLASEWVNENTDLIAYIVRQQLEAVLSPKVERLAALSSKTGHAAAAAMFLNVQAFMDLLPPEKRKIPREMYEKARKKAAEYMRTPLDEWNEKNNE